MSVYQKNWSSAQGCARAVRRLERKQHVSSEDSEWLSKDGSAVLTKIRHLQPLHMKEEALLVLSQKIPCIAPKREQETEGHGRKRHFLSTAYQQGKPR